MMNEVNDIISKCLELIRTGNAEEINNAQQTIEKLWNGKNIKKLWPSIFINEIEKFDSIKNMRNKVAFISVFKYPCLSYGKDNYNLFADFLFNVIQNKNGKLRTEAVYTFDDLIINPISILVLEQKIGEKEKKLLMDFYKSIDRATELIKKYMEPKYQEYEYIEDMPSSVYKSLQFLQYNMLKGSLANLHYEKYRQEKESNDIMSNYNLDNKDKWDLYYDAMEYLDTNLTKVAVKILDKALLIDNDFVAAHVGLVSAYEMEGNIKKMNQHIKLGYKKTLKKFPVIPERLGWGDIDNRQYFRAVFYRASSLQKKNKIKEAEKLYKLLLKWEPNDNIGARYYLAGLYEGLSADEIDALFEKGNKEQKWDIVENILVRQNKIHNFFIYIDGDFDD
ncbi:hypothetical protein KAU43_01855 [candidate division WOR-3 bacterium]|nr:hypothetical protein [candidate division WOR-3 bacterium]